MIVVYEVTSGDSFSNVKRWLHEIDTNCENVQKVLGEAEILTSKLKLENSRNILNFQLRFVVFFIILHIFSW